MKIASILLGLISLTGCAAKHYAVCMAVGQDSGCSHKRFTKETAIDIGKLMASQPGQDERTVWIEDMRKQNKTVAPPPKIVPQENNDNKL